MFYFPEQMPFVDEMVQFVHMLKNNNCSFFPKQTPSVDDLDEFVHMLKNKSRFAAFVFSSALGRGRSTVAMVAAAMIRHVILGKGNFAPISNA